MRELTITSIDLVNIINKFKKLEAELAGESKKIELLRHDDLMAKIEEDIETLERLGITNQITYKESSYINPQNKEQLCYSFNRDCMLQLLNGESALVKYKTIEYIDKLEEENKQKNKKPIDK